MTQRRIRIQTLVRVIILALLGLFGGSQASDGDRQKTFQQCLGFCRSAEHCERNRFPVNQTLLNKLFAWDCDSECKYRCMWITEEINRGGGQKPRQYYGKWPFWRVLGVQELGSSLFSVGNLLGNVYGYGRIYSRGADPSNWFMHGAVKLSFYMAINAWFWSMVFHARDVQFTMIMDYVSALALIFTNFALCIFRVFHVRDRTRQVLVAIPLVLYYLRHTYYMLFVKFSFGWNMQVAITLFAIYLFLFIIWSATHLFTAKRTHVKTVLATCTLMMMAATLEVFDFSPVLDLIDAHALWHAATIPVAVLWYRFYRDDADYDLGILHVLPIKTK